MMGAALILRHPRLPNGEEKESASRICEKGRRLWGGPANWSRCPTRVQLSLCACLCRPTDHRPRTIGIGLRLAALDHANGITDEGVSAFQFEFSPDLGAVSADRSGPEVKLAGDFRVSLTLSYPLQNLQQIGRASG